MANKYSTPQKVKQMAANLAGRPVVEAAPAEKPSVSRSPILGNLPEQPSKPVYQEEAPVEQGYSGGPDRAKRMAYNMGRIEQMDQMTAEAEGQGQQVAHLAGRLADIESEQTPAAPASKPEGAALKNWYGGLNVDQQTALLGGATPLLMGMLMGNTGDGAEIAGKFLYGQLGRDQRLSMKTRESQVTKPLTKANIVEVQTPRGSRFSRIEDAVGKKPAGSSSFNLQQKKDLAEFKAGLEKGSKLPKNTTDLRKEYNKLKITQNSSEISQQYQKIVTLSNSKQTGANDISMIFAYMKMLDPGSTVREGEQATARNAGSIPANIWQKYNRLVGGKDAFLPEEVRVNFINEATNIHSSQRRLQRQVDRRYKKLATKLGANPDDVVFSATTTKPSKSRNLKGADREAADWALKNRGNPKAEEILHINGIR